MNKVEFFKFYNLVVKKLGTRFKQEYPQFVFSDNPSSLYEEYINQKTMLRILYVKETKPDKTLLDRHKVCACITVAIIKIRLLSSDLKTDNGFELSNSSRINEQLAFMSAWELFKGFIRLHKENGNDNYELPDTYHNVSFLDTFTRSLFLANQLNALSTPIIANVFYLLEKYCEMENLNNELLTEQKLSKKM